MLALHGEALPGHAAAPSPGRIATHLEAALFLLRERLALRPVDAAPATPPVLAAQWQRLYATPQAPATVLPVDAARCFTLVLAALADWQRAAPAEPGLPARPAALLAAFEPALDAWTRRGHCRSRRRRRNKALPGALRPVAAGP